MKIYHCEVNHLTNPLGYQMEKTVFSWQVGETAAKLPKWSRLRVSEESDLSQSVYDSGEAELNSIACVVPLALKPRTRYYWRVTVAADNGETAVSAPAWFETGKRDEAGEMDRRALW